MPEIEPTECERRLAQWLWNNTLIAATFGVDALEPIGKIRMGEKSDIWALRRAIRQEGHRLPPELRVLAALKGWTDDDAGRE